MRKDIDYTKLNPDRKWAILLDNWRFGLWATFSSIGSILLGYEAQGQQQVVPMDSFQQTYGIPYPGQASGYLIPATWQSVWLGCLLAAIAVGSIFAGLLQNRIGRKHLLLIGAVVNAGGIGFLQGAKDWKQWLGGKILNGIGIGLVYTLSPVWVGETARPEIRGFFLCFFDAGVVFGQFLVALVSKGTSEIDGEWSWKSIVVMLYFFPAVLLIVWPFYPESPYYLMKKGRIEDARKSLQRIHGSKDPDYVEIELKRIQSNVQESDEFMKTAAVNGPAFYQIFRGVHRRRTLIASIPPAAQFFIGATFTEGYITYFFSLIGINQPFTVNSILVTFNILSCFAGFFAIEKFGRRTLIVPCVAILTIVMLAIGIAGTFPITNSRAQWSIVVFVFLWYPHTWLSDVRQIVYNCSLGVCGLAIASELGSLPLRAPTQSVVVFVQALTSWLFAFVIPYMINPDAGNLGGKIGYVFAGGGFIFAILLFLYLPETRGLTTDEIDYCFETHVNSRNFQQAIKVLREREGESVIKDRAHVDLNDNSPQLDFEKEGIDSPKLVE